MDDETKQRMLVEQLAEGRDLDRTHEMYHDDAVLEFPQSGERFVGKDRFLVWRKLYPARVTYAIRRITGRGELWVVELLVSYDGSEPSLGIGMFEFRGDKVARETIYVTGRFEPAAGRAEWATSFDPLAAVSPADWLGARLVSGGR